MRDAAISAYYVLGPCEAFSNLARFDSVRYGYHAPKVARTSSDREDKLARRRLWRGARKRRIMLGGYLLASGRVR